MATAELEIEVDCDTTSMARIYGGVTVSIRRITPDTAREMLSRNTKNRPLNKTHAQRFRDAIAAGEWWMNGETIIFATDGTLLNGQHRLWAVVASGVPIDVLVVNGIDSQAFSTIDGVRARRPSDVLAIDGEKNAVQLAAAVQALVAFVDGGGSIYTGSTAHGRKSTPAMCERVLNAHPGIRDSLTQMKRQAVFRNQHSIMLHYLFSIVSPELSAEFADVLHSGHTDIHRPFVIFREMCVRTPLRSDLRRAYAARAIKAFNAELANERPKMFKFCAGEEFPVISGLDYQSLADSIS